MMCGGATINAVRPDNYINQVIITSISIFVMYLVIPTRFSNQFFLTLTATVGEIFLVLFLVESIKIPTLVSLFLSLVFADIVGGISAWQVQKYRLRSFQDIAKSRELQKQLEQHTKQLEAIVNERTEKLKAAERLAAIGATAGMVGHDIRNPLTAITGAVYLAKKEIGQLPNGQRTENIKTHLDFIGDQTIYVNKIVEDLQDYARPLTPNNEEIDLEQIVKDVLSEVKTPQNIETEISIEEFNPKLKLDSVYMRRILTNLLNNAIQAMPEGGKITIKTKKEEEKAIISIEDTGVGIPEETKNYIFTPLFTTKSKGQGFGLAVAKRLIEGLNGSITFESEKGKGTKFIIEYPHKAE